MYGIFTYIYPILPFKTTIHVGKYTVRPMDGMGNIPASREHNKKLPILVSGVLFRSFKPWRFAVVSVFFIAVGIYEQRQSGKKKP